MIHDLHDCNRESGHVGRRAYHRALLREQETWSPTMFGWLQGYASSTRRLVVATMRRVYGDQLSKRRRVRFFIFPHWVLGQCENLISERFCQCLFTNVVAATLCVLGAGFHGRCVRSQRRERALRDISFWESVCKGSSLSRHPSSTSARCQGQGAGRGVSHEIVNHRDSRST